MKKLAILLVFTFMLICLGSTNSFAQKPYKKGKVTSDKVSLKRTAKKGHKKTYNKPKKSIFQRPSANPSTSAAGRNRQNKTHNTKKIPTEIAK